MFEPIEAPDVHRGPATGHTSEHGTTWQEAVSRINAGFKAPFERGESAFDASGIRNCLGEFESRARDFAHQSDERFDALEAKVAFLEEALSDALFKIDSHKTLLTSIVDQVFVAPALAAPAVNTDAATLPAA